MVALADGGHAALTAGRIDAQAGITARGGAITLSNTFVSPDASVKARALSKAGEAPAIVLREGAALDVSGRWADLQGKGVASPWLGRLDGGRVTLDSPHGIAVAAGSLIDVSGRAGKGGDVTLRAGAPEVEGATGALALAGSCAAMAWPAAADAGDGWEGGDRRGRCAGLQADPYAGRRATAQPLLLDPSLLGAGFAKYDINGRDGLRVAEGATLDVAMPVYRYEPGNEATGQRPAPALLLAPVYQENPLKGALTQRAARPDAALAAHRDGADIDIGAGALVSVDPGRTIRLLGGGSPYHRGRRAARRGAHRGGYRRAGLRCARQPASRTHNRAIWIGGAATLDVAGRAAGGVDIDGRRYGQAQAGGSIPAGRRAGLGRDRHRRSARDIAIVVRPGAVLDASGSRLAIDAPRGAAWGRWTWPATAARSC